jgi:hypothetical protein
VPRHPLQDGPAPETTPCPLPHVSGAQAAAAGIDLSGLIGGTRRRLMEAEAAAELAAATNARAATQRALRHLHAPPSPPPRSPAANATAMPVATLAGRVSPRPLAAMAAIGAQPRTAALLVDTRPWLDQYMDQVCLRGWASRGWIRCACEGGRLGAVAAFMSQLRVGARWGYWACCGVCASCERQGGVFAGGGRWWVAC